MSSPLERSGGKLGAPLAEAPGAIDTARRIRQRDISARSVIDATLADITARNPRSNAFTLITAERARAQADAIDAAIARGDSVPPLAGVPFAVKNLYDIQGEVTTAGSIVNRSLPAASQDAALVERLTQAGAVLVGALNMDEYAYGFSTENSHDGPARNPHDRSRIAGGSSGGSGAAVADRLVPLTLGTDTNGSIRVPASLCGVFGLKPTYGRLSRRGAFPFVTSLDHVGPFATNLADLALCYDLLQGADPHDPACAQRPVETISDVLQGDISGLRIAQLGGHFEQFSGPVARRAVAIAAEALQVSQTREWPLAAAGRSAAFIITGTEGGALHLPNLRERYDDFEPLSRDRFIAGCLIPAAWYQKAQRVRAVYARQVAQAFQHTDIFITAATPMPAPAIGTDSIEVNGIRLPARASMGLLTQPVSCIGLPVLAAPIPVAGELPIAIQIIAAPWRERDAFRVAAALVRAGVCHAPVPAFG